MERNEIIKSLAASMRHAARESVWHRPAASIGGGDFNGLEMRVGAEALEDVLKAEQQLTCARAIIGILCNIAESAVDRPLKHVEQGEIDNARAFLTHGAKR